MISHEREFTRNSAPNSMLWKPIQSQQPFHAAPAHKTPRARETPDASASVNANRRLIQCWLHPHALSPSHDAERWSSSKPCGEPLFVCVRKQSGQVTRQMGVVSCPVGHELHPAGVAGDATPEATRAQITVPSAHTPCNVQRQQAVPLRQVTIPLLIPLMEPWRTHPPISQSSTPHARHCRPPRHSPRRADLEALSGRRHGDAPFGKARPASARANSLEQPGSRRNGDAPLGKTRPASAIASVGLHLATGSSSRANNAHQELSPRWRLVSLRRPTGGVVMSNARESRFRASPCRQVECPWDDNMDDNSSTLAERARPL